MLGPLEAEIMEILWAADEPLPPRVVLGRVNEHRSRPLAYTMIVTELKRLAERQIAVRKRALRIYVYLPQTSDPADLAVSVLIREYGEEAVARLSTGYAATPRCWRGCAARCADAVRAGT